MSFSSNSIFVSCKCKRDMNFETDSYRSEMYTSFVYRKSRTIQTNLKNGNYVLSHIDIVRSDKQSFVPIRNVILLEVEKKLGYWKKG